MMKLYTPEGCTCGSKILIAAKYAGVNVTVVQPFVFGKDNHTPEFLKKSPMGRTPVLELENGVCIHEVNAAAKFVAQGCPAFLGKATPIEEALVDQFAEFALAELDLPFSAWVLPLILNMEANQAAVAKAKSDVRKVMSALNAHLATRTFLVGERVTLADVAVACSLLDGYKHVLDAGFRKEFKHLNRWFCTVVHQPNFKAVVGEVVLCTKAETPKFAAAAAAAPKEEKKPKEEKPKKEAKKAAKEEDEDDDGEEKEEKKAPNPLDLLPPSDKFKMDEWKRVYSNEDTEAVAIPWFWEHFDAEGYCLYFCKYKYELDQPQIFMVSNLLNGWMQRLDPLRKYGFGSLVICNDAKPFEIQGAWVFRGKTIPPEMTLGDDYELYNWTPCDPSKPEDKKLFTEFLSWNFTGLKFNQGKIYK